MKNTDVIITAQRNEYTGDYYSQLWKYNKNISVGVSSPSLTLYTLKRKCNFDEIFVIGGIEIFNFDSF